MKTVSSENNENKDAEKISKEYTPEASPENEADSSRKPPFQNEKLYPVRDLDLRTGAVLVELLFGHLRGIALIRFYKILDRLGLELVVVHFFGDIRLTILFFTSFFAHVLCSKAGRSTGRSRTLPPKMDWIMLLR